MAEFWLTRDKNIAAVPILRGFHAMQAPVFQRIHRIGKTVIYALQKQKNREGSLPLYLSGNQSAQLRFFFHNHFTVVVSAISAQPMRALVFAALRALHQSRSLDLPNV